MIEKHGNAKETDITPVLVITFVVLVAILIAKVAANFSEQKTSTASRASAAAISGQQNAWCQTQTPLNDDIGTRKTDPKVNLSGDYCINFDACGELGDTVHVKDMTTYYLPTAKNDPNKCLGYNKIGLQYTCCRSQAQMKKLGDSLCQAEYNNPNAKCVTDGSTPILCPAASTSSTNIKCAKIQANVVNSMELIQGTCSCPTVALPTSAPLSLNAKSCGKKHVDCTAINNGGVATNTDTVKNTSKSGTYMETRCVSKADNSDALCTNEATTSINDSIRCDGQQYLQSGSSCYMTTYAGMPSAYTANGTTKFLCTFTETVLGTGQKCKDLLHKN